MKKICVMCEKEFNGRKEAKYCSQSCFGKTKVTHGESRGSKFICLFCHNEKIRTRDHQKYCDASCQLNYEYNTGKRNPIETTTAAHEAVRQKGLENFQNNPRIHRGIRGYLMIYIPGRRDVYLHHWVWEQHNGPKPKGMHIHHIDGNKDNNKIENLQLISNSEHLKLHWKLKKKD